MLNRLHDSFAIEQLRVSSLLEIFYFDSELCLVPPSYLVYMPVIAIF